MSQLSDIIGNTPLLKISDKIYAKLETYNPTGSVKDRMVHYVVNKAFQQRKLIEIVFSVRQQAEILELP